MANPNYDDDKKNMDTQPSVTEQIREYIMENLLSVMWSASLLVGGLIFWSYFFQIQYFPDLSFAEAGLLLPVAAITGFIYLLVLVPIFMLPYVFRWIMLKQIELELDVKDRKIEKNAVVWHFLSILFLLLCIIYFVFSKWILIFLIGFIGFIGLFANRNRIGLMLDRIVKVVNELLSYFGKSKKEEAMKQKILYIFSWVASFIVTGGILCFFSAIVKKITPIDNSDHFLDLQFFLIFIISGNLIIGHYLESSKKSWWHVFFLVVWCFIFLLFSSFPKVAMYRFQFGSFTAERLIVDNKGCEILKSMELKPTICGKNGDLEGCYLKDIKILSRLGKVFVLEKEIDGKKYNFNIPKDQVLSWRILKKKANGESGEDQTSNSASAKTDTKKNTETCPKDEQAEAS
jgi:hypothetical protein